MIATQATDRTMAGDVVERGDVLSPLHRLVLFARALGSAARRGVAGAQLGTIDETEIGRKTGARR